MIVPSRRGPGPAAVLRGNEPHRATRCGGRRGVHEPGTARDEVGVLITANEVTPVPITAGDVATVPVTAGAKASVPVTAGDVVRRAPAERPRRTQAISCDAGTYFTVFNERATQCGENCEGGGGGGGGLWRVHGRTSSRSRSRERSTKSA